MSGKSCLLQELCWIGLLKKLFKQGVFRISMNKLRQNCYTIMDYLHFHM